LETYKCDCPIPSINCGRGCPASEEQTQGAGEEQNLQEREKDQGDEEGCDENEVDEDDEKN
jgi:hypothetical protein